MKRVRGGGPRLGRAVTMCLALWVVQVGVGSAVAQTKASDVAAMLPGAAAPAKPATLSPEQLEQARLVEQGRQVDQAKQNLASGAGSPIQELEEATDLRPVSAQALSGDGRPSVAPLIASRMTLYAGEVVVRRAPGALRRVAVGNGEVVSAFTVGKGEIVLIGTAPGETNVHLWMGNGTQRDISVTVAGGKVDGLAATVRQLLGNVPGLVVMPIGSNVVVSGADMDEGTTAKLALLQKAYPQILNFTGADPVGMRPMVMMDVQIMEFNKDSVEEIGIKWDSIIAGPVGGLIRDVTTNPYFRVLPENDTFDRIRDTLPTKLPGPQAYFGIATTIGSSINLLMNRGKAWVLASPKLSAKSGSSATFLVGGEIPIVIPSILGQSQVEYKEYGIRLNITPTVNARNQVSTSIMAEVSRIDPSVTVQGVPGFLTRRTETEINVNLGETIVLSGLLDRTASQTADKFPLLGDIPILGKLFRSDGFRGERTELVIFVTPRLISPTSPNNLEQLQRSSEIGQDLENDLSTRQRKLIK